MALQGTLQDFGLADIFQLIGIQRKTGILTLQHEEEVVTVSFLSGQVVYADTMSRRLEERIGHLLLKSGKITQEQLREALEIQKTTLQRLGTILLARKMITSSDLRAVLQVQVTQLIYNLFRWNDGEYHFSQEESIDYDRDSFTPVGAETLLMEGARIIDEWPLIEKRIPSFDLVLRRTAEAAAFTEPEEARIPLRPGDGGASGSLGEEEAAILILVDGRRTVQDIIDHSRLGDFETCRVLYELWNRNLLERGREEEREAGSAARVKRDWARVARLALPLIAALSTLTLPWNPLWPLGQGSLRTPDAIQWPVSRLRLERIALGLRVFYLENQALPRELEALVPGGILRREDLVDPWGRPYEFRIDATRYEVLGAAPDGGADPALMVGAVFPASQRLVVEGGQDTPGADFAP